MTLLDELLDIGCSLVPPSIRPQLTIKGFWDMDIHFQPLPQERLFTCHCLIAQTHHQGCSFYQEHSLQKKELPSLIGQSYQAAKKASLPIKIAVLDSLFRFGRKSTQPSRKLRQEGTPTEKALFRAKIVCEEVQLLAPVKNHLKPSCISILGVSGLIVHLLMQLKYSILACDLDPTLVGAKVCGNVSVLDGAYQEYCIQNSEVVIVTGMALATGTMENTFNFASNYGTKVVVYAQTGANLAPWYLLYGADVVICEPMPFYNFEGLSEIYVYRGKKQ